MLLAIFIIDDYWQSRHRRAAFADAILYAAPLFLFFAIYAKSARCRQRLASKMALMPYARCCY